MEQLRFASIASILLVYAFVAAVAVAVSAALHSSWRPELIPFERKARAAPSDRKASALPFDRKAT
eukprot:6029998-Prymnesium_polylepis.1